MPEKAPRVIWVDMAKGYGVILVIIGHMVSGPLCRWIYTFHMPLFFFLSGYLFNANRSFGDFLRRKIKTILVPYVCLGIPIILFDYFTRNISAGLSLSNMAQLVVTFLVQRRAWTLWYLACLFFLNILFFITIRVFRSRCKLAIFATVAPMVGLIYYKLGGPALPWNIDVCLLAYPFFSLGYLYKEKETMFSHFFYAKTRQAIAFIILACVNISCGYFSWKISGKTVDMFSSRYGVAPLSFISAFAGIACVVIASQWFSFKPLQYIGGNSILYYLWHQTIMIPVSSKILSALCAPTDFYDSIFIGALHLFVQVLIILVLLTVCNMIITKTRLRFVVGK